MHEFYFPFPPSVNGMYGGGSGQKRFKSKKYKEWERAAPDLPALGLTRVHIKYYLTFPDKRVRDSKNFLKAIDDWLVAKGVIVDDDWKCIVHEEIIPCGVNRDQNGVRVLLFSETTEPEEG